MKPRKPIILHIEDDADEREMFARATRGRYQIVSAGSAENAEETLAGKKVALIILDLALPLMNGFEFLASNKKRIAAKKIPVIITTGFTSESVHQLAIAHQCSALFIKPLDFHSVAAKIQELIG